MAVAGPCGLSGEPGVPGAGLSSYRRATWAPPQAPHSRCAPGSGRTDPPAGFVSVPCLAASSSQSNLRLLLLHSRRTLRVSRPTLSTQYRISRAAAFCPVAPITAAAARSARPSRNPAAPRASGTADAADPGPSTAPGTHAPVPAGPAVPPRPLRQRQPVAAHRNHRADRPQQPLLPVSVALEHPVPRLLRPPGRPVRYRDRPLCPLFPRRAQGLPLVLPQPPRGRPVQNRGFLGGSAPLSESSQSRCRQ